MNTNLSVAVPMVHEEAPEQLDTDDLEKEVEIVLSETETIWMLEIPGSCVALDSDEAETVKRNNETYAEVRRDVLSYGQFCMDSL